MEFAGRFGRILKPKPIDPLWAGEPCIVAAPGPSLTPEVAKRVRLARWTEGWRLIVVNDAYRYFPYADILYAADFAWWKAQDLKDFKGERWSCHSHSESVCDDKSQVYEALGLRLVLARDGKIISKDPCCITYGRVSHSGYHALNIALLLGCSRVVLVGYDMRHVDGKAHFFERKDLRLCSDDGYRDFCKNYEPDDRVINATPESALKCFPQMSLEDAIDAYSRGQNGSVHRDGAEPHVATG